MTRILRAWMVTATACCLALPFPAPTVAAPAGWTGLAAPTPKYGGGLSGISCVSASFCEAVGYKLADSSGSRIVTLAEQWNGSSVRIQNDPARQALGVSCVSTTFCMEVGYYSDQHGYPANTTAARWNGTRWRSVTTPAVNLDSLEAVSCWSRTGCVAVGAHLHTFTSYARPLVERWNGKAWRVQKAPTATQWLNHLSGVSCVSGSACLAVGQSFLDSQGRDSRTLAERWNGRSWQIVKTPTLRQTYQPDLKAVSCIAARDCVAVGGGSAEHSLILHWTGRQFVRETPASPQGQDLPPPLSGVSCTSATFCMATGVLPFNGMRAEQWDGTHWTMTDLPNGGGGNDGYDPVAVSCPTTSSCNAVGDYLHHRHGHVVFDEWAGP